MKPVSCDDLILSVKRALERRRLLEIVDIIKEDSSPKLAIPEVFKDITTNFPKMVKMLREVELLAVSDVLNLIHGKGAIGEGHPSSQSPDKVIFHPSAFGLYPWESV